MTFDELMEKYMPLIERAAAAHENSPGTANLALAPLVLALKGDLQNALQGEDLDKGALMAANELVSRFLLPEGSGAGFEGQFGGFSEADALNPIDATIEAPVLVVEFLQPGFNTVVSQKNGKLVYKQLDANGKVE